jgi:diadenosine tetraphosphate (Ap4A) HIT family hydrolase
MSSQRFFYETVYFCVEKGNHICRTDGGHIIVHPRPSVVNRWELEIPHAKALIRISMLLGEAMMLGLKERGIAIERINFQDNGNWSIDMPNSPRPYGPHFHLHLYGRARGSKYQKHGEALYFPDRDSDFWKNNPLEPLNADDLQAILNHIHRLSAEERYQLSSWGLEAD